LEKQTLVHEAKLNVQDEFAKKEKDNEIKQRISRSAEIGECRVKKMQIRDDLLQGLLKDAAAKCAVVARGGNYPQLLQKLIVQGLIKIEENEVLVYCRSEDVATVTKILPAAVAEYVDILKRESGVTLKPLVTINTDRSKDLKEDSFGGVLLTALNGKIHWPRDFIWSMKNSCLRFGPFSFRKHPARKNALLHFVHKSTKNAPYL
jgi:V-type H+-transporting ATPase subunit E